jgi:hypothetical protein
MAAATRVVSLVSLLVRAVVRTGTAHRSLRTDLCPTFLLSGPIPEHEKNNFKFLYSPFPLVISRKYCTIIYPKKGNFVLGHYEINLAVFAVIRPPFQSVMCVGVGPVLARDAVDAVHDGGEQGAGYEETRGSSPF